MSSARKTHTGEQGASHEGEEKNRLRCRERRQGTGAQCTWENGRREDAEERAEDGRREGQLRTPQRRCHSSEANAPQKHPQGVTQKARRDSNCRRREHARQGSQYRPAVEVKRRQGGPVPKSQTDQDSGSRGGGNETNPCSGCQARAKHARKQPTATVALKGEVVSERRAVDTWDCPMEAESPFQAASVLVVEDGLEVLHVLERTLSDNGYDVFTATDGDAGLAAALDRHPDLVILDIGLPKRNGYEVTRELRARAFDKPVLMLTARDSVVDKVEGLDAGADDYLAKPFDYDELLARVRALLRRSSARIDQRLLKVLDLAIDPFSRDVRRGDREIVLTQKEYALLEYLARHAERPVSREQISEHVWKQELDPTTNIVDVYINYLRKKVDAEGEKPLVQTVRGVGYMLSAER